MNDQIRVDVNKICRSIDALTKEIHLLRKDLSRRDRFESCKEIKSEVLVPLKLEGRRTVRNGDLVIKESGSDEAIGTVASGSFAPSLGFAVAFAFVKKEYADNGSFVLKAGRSEIAAKKTTAPFYTEGTARIKLS